MTIANRTRTLIGGLLGATAIGLAASATAHTTASATAPSPCGGTYVVNPGDTLAEIAARCDTTVGALMRANEVIGDPRYIEIGWRLDIPSAEERRLVSTSNDQLPSRDYGGDGAYEVRPGDTLFGISQRLGLSLAGLLAANAGIDPHALYVGQRIALPGGADHGDRNDRGDRQEFRQRVDLEAKVIGENRIRIFAEGLTPGETVTYGVGRPHTESTRLGTARVAPDGEIMVDRTVPPHLRDEDRLRVVVVRPGIGSVSTGVTGFGQARDDDGIRVSGRVSQGVECPVLTTSDGDVYSLTGDMDFTPGETVEVEGDLAEYSTCMQGEATIVVEDLRETG